MEMNCRKEMNTTIHCQRELLEFVNVHQHSDILFSCKLLWHSADGRSAISLLVPLRQKGHENVRHSKHNRAGRQRRANRVRRARAISPLQLPTAEAFILMSHPLSHFSPAQCLIFTRLGLALFAKPVAGKSLLEPQNEFTEMKKMELPSLNNKVEILIAAGLKSIWKLKITERLWFSTYPLLRSRQHSISVS